MRRSAVGAVVNVLTPGWPGWDHRLLHGVQRYGEGLGWSVRYEAVAPAARPLSLGPRPFDGLILAFDRPGEAERFRGLRAPAAFVFNPPAPRCRWLVQLDEAAIGRLGAAHLLERGFRRLGFHGFASEASRARQRGFCAAAAAAGAECVTHDRLFGRLPDGAAAMGPACRAMLAKLAFPAGMMAFNDELAIALMTAAAAAGVRVPADLAVIGADNYEMTCLYRPVTLSSVDPDIEAVGYAAAELLRARLERRPASPRVVAPGRVVARDSTRVLIHDDPIVREALAVMNGAYHEAVGTPEIAARVGVSKRTLEKHVSAALGRAPAAELRRIRLARAHELLCTTGLPLPEIARRTGFAHAAHLSTAYLRAYHVRPGKARPATRRHAGAAGVPAATDRA